MTMSTRRRLRLAHDALAGLATGDAVGNRGFPTHTRVTPASLPNGTCAWTDDTQMACSVVDVLHRHGRVDQDTLARLFAERAEPKRDYGMGATRFLERVRAGADWREESRALFDGVGSWGNGGAMRVPPLGAYYSDDLARAATEAGASAEVTHAHPEGVAGGVAAGVAAARAAALRGTDIPVPAVPLLEAVLDHTPASDVRRGIERSLHLLHRPTDEAARKLGNGSRISAPDTVPFALWVVARYLPDYAAAVRACIAAGGDMDTTAAIAGGIIAAHHGAGCVPAEWRAIREPLPAWLPAPPDDAT